MSTFVKHKITNKGVGNKIWRYLRNNPIALDNRNKKISKKLKGKKKNFIPQMAFQKGHVPWNKGKKMGVPWNKGKSGIYSPEALKKMSGGRKGKHTSPITEFKKGHIPWHKGRRGVYSQEAIDKMREARLQQVLPRINTKIEMAIQTLLQENKIIFKPQEPLENVCVADFYIPASKKVIFCDGDYWHNLPSYIKRDQNQNEVLVQRGYKVIRLWEHEIKNDLSSCLQKIL